MPTCLASIVEKPTFVHRIHQSDIQMSVQTILDDIQTRANRNTPIGSSIKFDFGDGQVIHIDGTGDANVVTQDDKDAACVVHVSASDMLELLQGKLNPMTAFMFGKLKVKGDMGVAMKLQSFLGGAK